jgi:competence protein ComEA
MIMARQQKIDINEASKEELIRIAGIDDKTAQAIIEYRESHGRINDIDELADAEEINPRDLDALREWLTTGSEGEEQVSEEEEEW